MQRPPAGFNSEKAIDPEEQHFDSLLHRIFRAQVNAFRKIEDASLPKNTDLVQKLKHKK